MTPDYFETALRGLYEANRLNSENLGKLIQTVDLFIDSTHAFIRSANARMEQAEGSHQRLEDAHNQLQEAMAEYTREANARMKQMEQNLDALIRIITAEHTNGKGKI